MRICSLPEKTPQPPLPATSYRASKTLLTESLPENPKNPPVACRELEYVLGLELGLPEDGLWISQHRVKGSDLFPAHYGDGK